MSTVQEIESAIAKLPMQDKEAVRDWLDELIENQLAVSEEFKEKIQRVMVYDFDVSKGILWLLALAISGRFIGSRSFRPSSNTAAHVEVPLP